jgi:hypothetical protein
MPSSTGIPTALRVIHTLSCSQEQFRSFGESKCQNDSHHVLLTFLDKHANVIFAVTDMHSSSNNNNTTTRSCWDKHTVKGTGVSSANGGITPLIILHCKIHQRE